MVYPKKDEYHNTYIQIIKPKIKDFKSSYYTITSGKYFIKLKLFYNFVYMVLVCRRVQKFIKNGHVWFDNQQIF